MENLVAEGRDDVGLEGVGRTTAKLIVSLGSGDQLILGLASAVGSTESVVAHARNVGAFTLGTLLDQHQTTSLARAERVGGVAVTSNGVLNRSTI